MVMKQTILFLGLVISLFFVKQAQALVPIEVDIEKDFQLLPTATPTKIIIIKKEIDTNIIQNLKLINTLTPTPKTVVVTTVVTPTPENTPMPTLEEKNEITVTPEPTLMTKKADEKSDMSLWFMGITIAALAVIVLVQAWPKKNIDGEN